MIAVDKAKYHLEGGVANRSKQFLLFSDQRTEIKEIRRMKNVI